MKKSEHFISTGAWMAALAVALGAFGAHALKGKIGYDLLEVYMTGTQYLTIHALATLLYGFWVKQAAPTKHWPGLCFMIGSAIFAGSLYAITFTGIRMFGAITPIGGVLLIAGWVGFALQAHKQGKTNS